MEIEEKNKDSYLQKKLNKILETRYDTDKVCSINTTQQFFQYLILGHIARVKFPWRIFR